MTDSREGDVTVLGKHGSDHVDDDVPIDQP